MRKLSLLVLCLVLFLTLTVTIGFANGAEGSPTYGDQHVSGSRENDENRIGSSCLGLRWNYKPTIVTTPPTDDSADKDMVEHFIVKLANGRAICDYTVKDKAYYWAVLQKDLCDGKGFKNFSWKAWNSSLEYPCLYHKDPKYMFYPNGIYVEPVIGEGHDGEVITGNVPHKHDYGKLKDGLLQDTAQQFGWAWFDDEGWYTRGGEHLDIVWRNTKMDGMAPTPPPPGDLGENSKLFLKKVIATDYNGSPKNPVFEYNHGITSGGWDHEDTDAEWLYFNGILSCDYSFQSANGQHSYSNTVYAESIYACMKEEQHMCNSDHGCDGDHDTTPDEDGYYSGHDPEPVDCKKYWTAPGPSYSRTFTYTTIQPQLRYVLFTPYNLNRNGPCVDDDFGQYYGPSNGPNLVMSVDNKQGIYDGRDIHMLDTNDKIPFNVTIGNDQLGIPEFGNGGWTLFDHDPGYSASMGLEGGYTEPSTGTLISTGPATPGEGVPNNTQVYDITNRVSDDMHYNGSLNGKSKGMEIFSWQSSGDGLPETYSKDFNLHKLPGWRGADYDLRSIYYGTYIINNGAYPFWEIDYTQCRYWTYGVKYSGKVQVYNSTGGPSAFVRVEHPTVHERISDNSYQAQVESDFVQPFLRASFLVKTVGGNYG